jgi:hypothetical protein
MTLLKACIVCAVLGVTTVSQAWGQSIVGAWTHGSTMGEGASVFVFLADGHFYMIQNAQAAEAPHGFDGFERGTYTWNPATGALSVALLQDLNGDTGFFANGGGPAGIIIAIDGDTATATVPGEPGAVILNRVAGTSPIVGAWTSGNAGQSDRSAVLVLLPNGVYFEAEDGDSSAATGDPTGHDGIEHGTYSWNPVSGLLTSSRTPAPYTDTNGEWGLSHTGTQLTFRVSADGMTLNGSTGPTDSFSLTRVGPASSVPSVANYQGLWWNAPAGSESGWGINFAHQGDVIFATWFTYDATGKALWLSMTATQTAEHVFAGTLYQTRGPAFSASPFSPAAVTAKAVGTGTLTFSDVNNGRFAYAVNGIAQTKAITRQAFGPLPTCTFGAQPNLALATNYQDLWWGAPAGSESGWGVNFTHQGDTIFATWFTYDSDGAPLWLSATVDKTAPGVYSGTLYRTTGPAFSAVPFLPASIGLTAVGPLTLTFANGNSATYAYTVNGVTQTKSIVRQVFRAPGTVCH